MKHSLTIRRGGIGFFIPVATILCLSIILPGCSNNNTSGPIVGVKGDLQAIQQIVTEDSLAELVFSDEGTLDDGGPIEDSFEKTLTPVKPFGWERTIGKITRSIDVDIIGDSIAIATVTKTISGELKLYVSYSDSALSADTVVQKPFSERVQRKIRFRRIARSTTYERNWRPVGITLVVGGAQPDSVNKFTISSIEISFPAGTDTVIDPLNTWLRFGRFWGCVPYLAVNDSAEVRLKIVSADPDTEFAVLRYKARPMFYFSPVLVTRRTRMSLVGSEPGDIAGTYVRTYRSVFHGFLHDGFVIGRFNAVVDVFSHGTIYDDTMPFSNRFWGIPYVVVAQ